MKKLLIALCVALSVAACGSPTPGEGQAHSGGGDNGLLWGLGGYLLGRMSSSSAPAPQVHNHYSSPSTPVVTEQKKLHQGQATVPPKPITAPAPKPSNPYSSFSGTGKTYAPSRPSFSSPSRSYGGGRR